MPWPMMGSRILHSPDPVYSLDAEISPGEGKTFEEFLADELTPRPDEALIRKDAREIVKRGLERLPMIQAIVLIMRWGLLGSETHTLQEVSKVINRTKERARQIESVAFNNIRRVIVFNLAPIGEYKWLRQNGNGKRKYQRPE
jgi:DNA-directed RNA polymerase sigma subunit (sigma70/sigma32)